MIFQTLPGRCLISFELDETSVFKPGMKFDIILPDNLRRKARIAFCHLHNSTFDEDFTEKRIIVDRWSGRPFKVQHADGKEYEYYIISQYSVLATLDELTSQEPAQ